MTPEQMGNRITQLERLLASFMLSDRFILMRTLQMQDGRNVLVGRGTGTKIATAADQKLGFYGATPVIRPSAIGAAAAQGATYNQTDVQSIATAVNSVRTALTALGLTL